MTALKNLNKIILLLLSFTLLFSFSACNEKKDDYTPPSKAEFTSRSKMFKTDGFSIILDANFERSTSNDTSISAVDGDLTFEAFYFEKYYFEEKDANVKTPFDALQYVNKDKEIGINKLSQPYVKYSSNDSHNIEYTFYYVCIEDEERYWFCTFFAPEYNFAEYEEKIFEYLGSISAEVEENS